ncbi:MAG TPA: AMP-binding protein, partial [Candidatus Accumulibacter phosphatis]|nr:AMP-binding protein [Candidatus Accumulibacter phosphatis]
MRDRWHYTGQLPPARFNMARYCLSAAARATPDKVALVVVSDAKALAERAEHWTYAQLDKAVRQMAAGLRALGLEPGARLMIRMGNTSDYVLLFFGAIAAGCVPLPSSAQLTEEEADFLLADSGARIVAMSEELTIQAPPGVQVLGSSDIALLRNRHEALDYADTAADDPAFLIYTSGTTGQP